MISDEEAGELLFQADLKRNKGRQYKHWNELPDNVKEVWTLSWRFFAETVQEAGMEIVKKKK